MNTKSVYETPKDNLELFKSINQCFPQIQSQVQITNKHLRLQNDQLTELYSKVH